MTLHVASGIVARVRDAILSCTDVAFMPGTRRQRREARRQAAAERDQAIGELHDALLQDLQGLILRFHAVGDRRTMQESAVVLLEGALESAEQLLNDSRLRLQQFQDIAQASGLLRRLEEVALRERLAAGSGPLTTVRAVGWRQNVQPDVIEKIATFFAALIEESALAGSTRIDTLVRCRRASLEMTFERDGQVLVQRKKAELPDNRVIAAMERIALELGGQLVVSAISKHATRTRLRIPAGMAYAPPVRGALPR